MTEEEYLIVANLTRLRVVDATLKAIVFLDAEVLTQIWKGEA